MVHRERIRARAMRIAILAALPGELKPLVKGWERVPSPTRGISLWVTTSGTDASDEYIAVCGGMGAPAALRSFAAAEQFGTLDLAISVGWAGALTSAMQTGHCYLASEVIDVLTGERFQLTEGHSPLRLVTTPRVVDKTEKRRLRDSYSAALVDMEAAAICRLAQIRGIPAYCFKAVSDGVDARLPDLNPFIDIHGQLQLLPFLAHVAIRPSYWGSLIQMGKSSSAAAHALADAIRSFLQHRDISRIDQTGAV
jgi:adenosylhomocysteine nucleosidase